MPSPRGPLLCLVLVLAAAAPPGAAGELLPEVSVHLLAARYAPSEPELRWTGWVGAGAGVVRVKEVTAYFTAEVESVLGDVRRPFDANQANYHLQVGLRRPVGAFVAGPFFHHVSRHAVDRDKPEAVDWNVLGLRASGPLTRSVRISASVGHTTLTSLVGYRWELVGGLDVDVSRPGYLRGRVRVVTVDSSEAFPRGDFLDMTFEGGGRWRRQERMIETFVAFDRRNDVFLLTPGARTRALLGFRITYSTR